MIYHDTSHVLKRAAMRGFTVEQLMATLENPVRILKWPPRRGNHGGFIRLFFREHGGRVLVVVAEVAKNETWIITAYWEG